MNNMENKSLEDRAMELFPYVNVKNFDKRDYHFETTAETNLQRAPYLRGLKECMPLVEALRMIEKHCQSDEDSEGACFAIKNIVFNAIASFPQPTQEKQLP